MAEVDYTFLYVNKYFTDKQNQHLLVYY